MQIWIEIVLGLFAGTITAIILFGIVFGLSAGVFSNKPGVMRSGLHFFTDITPGQVKIAERGKVPVRFIMKTPGKKFARTGGDRHTSEYWAPIDAPAGESEDPTADVWLPIRWWASLVYKLTGYVFTGIYPWQKVREYPLGRTIVERNESGENRVQGRSNLILTEKKDISDHFRTFQFQYATHIMGAETKDKIPLDIIGIAELIVTRPYLTAYYAERWDILVMAWIKDKVNDVTKSLALDEVLASNDVNKRAIQEAVTNITGSEEVFGIVFRGFRILEINPQLDAEGLKKIQAEAFAKQLAKATEADGQARANVVVMMAKASGSQAAQRALAAETQIKTAEAAGDGAIIYLGGGQPQTDTTQMAILAELRKLNKAGKKPEPEKGGTE